ncbi:MAG: twin-arginine translocase TatA/TatE family subunit [Planctomycetota bacterium]|nr:twin-arginine translocase TatA/TatE family subunit [Planctomycetota bacterium]
MNLELMWVPGPWEMAIIAVVGLLFFGRNLPSLGRSLGRSIVEFKKGIKGIEDDIDDASDSGSSETKEGQKAGG